MGKVISFARSTYDLLIDAVRRGDMKDIFKCSEQMEREREQKEVADQSATSAQSESENAE